MRQTDETMLYSASDLVTFLGCRHAVWLDLQNQDTPLPRAQEDEGLLLLQEKGIEHEQQYLERLQEQGLRVVSIQEDPELGIRIKQTLEAMRDGPDIIYQAVLLDPPWYGYADFLRRVDGPSVLGGYGYEVLDTKLARNPSVKHVMQIGLYSDLLNGIQKTVPQYMCLILGDGREVRLRTKEFSSYINAVRRRFEAFCGDPPADSYPERCAGCDMCHWRELCWEQWERDDHLVLVADIRRSQIQKLNQAGIRTLEQLAGTKKTFRCPGMAPESFQRLRDQAQLHFQARKKGEDIFKILPEREERGFARLPRPDPGDLFFDIEGDPLYPDGLEYLFGVFGHDGSGEYYRPFWGHDHDEEKQAFQQLMDFFRAQLEKHPAAHIYHYNHYEVTAIKRLSARYAVHESLLDDFLRGHVFVDLYRVVRDAVMVSRPAYSLKEIEPYYMEKRDDEVQTAGESIVLYELWRRSGDQDLLEQIRDYNRTDCRSTFLLREWLLSLRPQALPWYEIKTDQQKSDRITEAEQLLAEYLDMLSADESDRDGPLKDLLADMLDFHRREAKPSWWAMFDRQERDIEGLIEDAECLAGLETLKKEPPRKERRSYIFRYKFPPQESKLNTGKKCLKADDLEPAGTMRISISTKGSSASSGG